MSPIVFKKSCLPLHQQIFLCDTVNLSLFHLCFCLNPTEILTGFLAAGSRARACSAHGCWCLFQGEQHKPFPGPARVSRAALLPSSHFRENVLELCPLCTRRFLLLSCTHGSGSGGSSPTLSPQPCLGLFPAAPLPPGIPHGISFTSRQPGNESPCTLSPPSPTREALQSVLQRRHEHPGTHFSKTQTPPAIPEPPLPPPVWNKAGDGGQAFSGVGKTWIKSKQA